jgi:excinuclease UvrABC ATPase subunit
MKITNLSTHNISNLSIELSTTVSTGLSGFSGSGKSSFCEALNSEVIKRIVTILPKSQYNFLFPELIKTNYGVLDCSDLPCIEYLDNQPSTAGVRSTVGTHSTLFGDIRKMFAASTGKSSDYFSFNTPVGWCTFCKGRGTTRGTTCNYCNGTRYADHVLQHELCLGDHGFNIAQANGLSLEYLHKISHKLSISPLFKRITSNAIILGIGYISLDRNLSSLSGGEYTRLLLAERMGLSSQLLYILDEPGLGLDERSSKKVLRELQNLGKENAIWIVDHSPHVVLATQKQIYFGPGSGSEGGRIVESLLQVSSVPPRPVCMTGKSITFTNLHCRTIALKSLSLPTGAIVTFTGESGCGKSTLLRDILLPKLKLEVGSAGYVYVGQGRSKAVTSRSTIGTFLGFSSYWHKLAGKRGKSCHYCNGSGVSAESLECNWCCGTGRDPQFYQMDISHDLRVIDLLERPIKDIVGVFSLGSAEREVLDLLIKLGAGYLSLSRRVQSLSNGEFQRLHLCQEIASDFKAGRGKILILDEPSRGLSHNYLHDFCYVLQNYVSEHGYTVWMVEHNRFMLDCSDFVVDFGERREVVDMLNVVTGSDWKRVNPPNNQSPPIITASITLQSGVEFLGNSDKSRLEIFRNARKIFESGVLRTLSPTARWIYADQQPPHKQAVVAIDFEDDLLYSEDMYLFELLDIVGKIQMLSVYPHSELPTFDYLDRNRLCRSCRGRGKVDSIDFNLAIESESDGIFHGLLHKDVFDAIRSWNLAKIKFLFAQLKSTMGIDLTKSPESMSKSESLALWYGVWDRSFYWKAKESHYQWRGLNHLIQKYMRSSKSPLKSVIFDSKFRLDCPVCNGTLLGHSQALNIRGIDIRDILRMPIKEAAVLFQEVAELKELAKICPADACLDSPIGTWPHEDQVHIKVFELAQKSLFGFSFYFQNIVPFMNEKSALLHDLSKNNKIYICDDTNIVETRKTLINKHKWITSTITVSDALGFAFVGTSIRKVKREAACPCVVVK